MGFRPLTNEEVRAYAQAQMRALGWEDMRDKVVELFGSRAEVFGFCWSSEYNDEGYDPRRTLDYVNDADGVSLYEDNELTEQGEEIIRASEAFGNVIERYKKRGYPYEPDPGSYVWEVLSELSDGESDKLWLEDGETGEVVAVHVTTGPIGSFPTLYIAEDETREPITRLREVDDYEY